MGQRVGIALWANVAILAALIFVHPLWFDEAQGILIARAPWPEFWEALHYEGHPALWYLLVGFVRALSGSPIAGLVISQFLIAGTMSVMIWTRSPFSFATKLLIVCGYFFAFEYGVISRSYGLAAALLLLAVDERKTIWGWVFLALAVNTEVHFAIVATALAAIFYKRYPVPNGLLIFIAGGLAAAVTVLPRPHDALPAVQTGGPLAGAFIAEIWRLSVFSVPHPIDWGVTTGLAAGCIMGLLAPVTFFLSVKDKFLRLLFAGLLCAFLALGTFYYPLYARHIGALVIFAICCLWVQAEDHEAQPNRLAMAWLSIMAVAGLGTTALSLTKPFSPDRKISDWILAHHLEHETWTSWPGTVGVPISAILTPPPEYGPPILYQPISVSRQYAPAIINGQAGCAGTYVRWNFKQWQTQDAENRLAAIGARYVISAKPLKGKLLAEFADGMVDSPRYLYFYDRQTKPQKPCI